MRGESAAVRELEVMGVWERCSMYKCCIITLTIKFFFFFNDTATTEIYTLSLHDALPISFLNREPLEPSVPKQKKM